MKFSRLGHLSSALVTRWHLLADAHFPVMALTLLVNEYRLGKQTDFSNSREAEGGGAVGHDTGFLRRAGRESKGRGGPSPLSSITLPHSTKLTVWVFFFFFFFFQRLPGHSVTALGLSGINLAPSSGTLVFLPWSQCLLSGNQPPSPAAALHGRVGVASNHRSPGGLRKARKPV